MAKCETISARNRRNTLRDISAGKTQLRLRRLSDEDSEVRGWLSRFRASATQIRTVATAPSVGRGRSDDDGARCESSFHPLLSIILHYRLF